MWLDKLKENWILIISSLVVITFLFFRNDGRFTKDDELIAASSVKNIEALETDRQEIVKVTVDIKGEVENPGVYEVDLNTRINDVIQLAGGFSEGADEMLVNLAQKVQDEMTIIVPLMGAESESVSTGIQAGNGKVNLNYATQEEIETLNGIGPSKALAIIQYREDNGPFQKLEDLLEVSGIGAKTLENLEENIQVP